MGVVSSLYNVIYYSGEAKKDLGKLQVSLEASRLKSADAKHIKEEAALEKMQDELFNELSQKLLDSTGFNSGFFDYYGTRAENLTKGMETLARLMQFANEMASRIRRALTGAGGKVSLTEKMEYINASTLVSSVQNMIQALQNISERERYIDRSKVLMCRSAVQFGISTVSFAISVGMADRSKELEDINKSMKATQPGSQQYAEYSQQYQDLERVQRIWKAINIGVKLLEVWASWETDKLARQMIIKQKKKGTEMVERAWAKASSDQTQSYANTIRRMEIEATRLKLEAGDIQNNLDRLTYGIQLVQDLMHVVSQSVELAGEASGLSYHWIKEPENTPAYQKHREEEKEEEAKRKRILAAPLSPEASAPAAVLSGTAPSLGNYKLKRPESLDRRTERVQQEEEQYRLQMPKSSLFSSSA
jgi:hypothetical protein